MSTYGTMQTRIADEIGDSGLTTQIRRAIQSAIAHYEGTRFWFKEERATSTTSAGTEFYALPSDFQELDSLLITVNGNRYTLTQRDWGYLEALSVTTANTAQPMDFAIYEEQLRLYPVPNDAYTLTMSYVRSLSTLSDDSDSNAWMTSGEELIRSRAKWDVLAHVTMDPGQAAVAKAAEMAALQNLLSRTTRRIATGHLRPTVF